MIQIASETTFKYATALFSEVWGVTLSILHESAAKFPKTFNTSALKSILNNKCLRSAGASFWPKEQHLDLNK